MHNLRILDDIEKLKQILNDHEKRLSTIESSLHTPKKPSSKQYVELSGGIRFLIDNGFFMKPKTKKEVHQELRKEGYYHSPPAVDTALRRDFVSNKKTLVRIEEDSLWKYVLRK